VKNILNRNEQRILLFSVFILSLCGIIYELVLGSLASYLLGNPVQQYSITIGVFLSSMGLGSYLSRFFEKDLLKTFIRVEIALGLTGGLSVIILNYLFSFSASFYALHVFFLVIIGTLVGLEIPLLTRILKSYGSLKEIISSVLTLDYIGGLAGSLLFPLVLFPYAGRFLTSILVGIMNIGVAIYVISKIKEYREKRTDIVFALISLLILIALALNSDWINAILQKKMFYDDIVFMKRSRYQEIVLTRNGSDFRLYLDGSLQFSTSDEYRYHEMLVYPAILSFPAKPESILVMGGGDGLAVREILKFDSVKKVILVELDGFMADLAKNNSTLKMINKDSLSSPKVKLIVGDAYDYLLKNRNGFDVIIADFTDPHDETISKLYTEEFFRLVKRSLTPGGIFVTQSTSPLFAREAFWCINRTMSSEFKYVYPYHAFIPTFGDWGFNLASDIPLDLSSGRAEVVKGRFYSRKSFMASMVFPQDAARIFTEKNTFNKPVLYKYYLKGWKNSDY